MAVLHATPKLRAIEYYSSKIIIAPKIFVRKLYIQTHFLFAQYFVIVTPFINYMSNDITESIINHYYHVPS